MKPIRWLLRLFAFLAGFVLLAELGAWAYFQWVSPPAEPFAESYAQADKEPIRSVPWSLPLKSHPLFGFVCDETYTKEPCNNYGFRSRFDFPYQKKPDEVVIGFFGGSVARGVGQELEARNAELAQAYGPKLGGWEGKKIVFVNFALEGYRQPQQYIVATQAADWIDAAIFLDGAGEMSEAPYPAYPLDFPALTPRFFDDPGKDPELKKRIFALRGLHQKMSELALDLPLLPESSAYFFVWSTLGRYGGEYVKSLSDTAPSGGPSRFYPAPLPPEQLDAGLYRNWEKYTELSYRLFRDRGLAAYHFVQPSQYVPEAKTFSAEESKVAISADEQNAARSRARMLMLREGVGRLQKRGVPIWDFTAFYQSVQEPIYVDDCCRVNGKGQSLLTQGLLDAIVVYRRPLAKAR